MEAKEFAIARLDVKPGDTLVAKYNGVLSAQVRARLNDQLRDIFPGIKVIVVDHAVDFAVISAEAPCAIEAKAALGES